MVNTLQISEYLLYYPSLYSVSHIVSRLAKVQCNVNMYVDTYCINTAIYVFSHFFSITSFTTAFLVHVDVYNIHFISVVRYVLAIIKIPFDQEAVGIIIVQKVVLCACLDKHVN